MRDPGDRTKVVLRHLPSALSRSALKDQIDTRFAGRYNWFSFRPGKNSHRNQQYSRAYIDFRRLEDVIEFAQAFDGHVFVNEKGSRFKAIVEYAPSQRVPKYWSKKDGREGTIFKDSEYLEFLEVLAKPVDNIPSAEVQLERREAERAGAGTKVNLIVTPLMDYVRQKRATKSGFQRSVASSGRLGRRAGGASSASSSSVSRRGLEKRRTATIAYVLRDNTRIVRNKDRSTYILVPRREDQQHLESDLSVQDVSNTDILEDHAVKNLVTTTEGMPVGGDGLGEAGKRKVLLLKNKEKEPVNGHITEASSPNGINIGFPLQSQHISTIRSISSIQQIGGASNQQGVTSPVRGSSGTSSFKQNRRFDASGRIGRGILVNKELQQLSSTLQAEQQNQASYTHRDEKVASNDYGDATIAVKQDRRMRNKDRPDRPVWTPRQRSDGTAGADESQTCIASASARASLNVIVPIRYQANLEGASQSQLAVTMGFSDNGTDDTLLVDNSSVRLSVDLGKSRYVEASGAQTVRLNHTNTGSVSLSENSAVLEEKTEMMMINRIRDAKAQGSGWNNFVGENGNYRHVMRRPPASGMKELDGSLNVSDTKSPKRGGILGYGSHEKQVWVAVQKSVSGS